jgi:hypothetical protein
MRTTLIALSILLALVLPAGLAKPMLAQDNATSYGFCVLVDNVRSTVYFSSIFTSNPTTAPQHVDAFHNFLHKSYPRIYGTPTCGYADGIFTAQRQKAGMQERYGRAYRSVIETGWKY